MRLTIDNRGRYAPGIGVLKFSHISSAPRPQDSTTRLLFKKIGSRVYNLSIMAQQQELDPVRIFRASVSAVLLDDGLTGPKETAKRTLIPAKCLIYKIRFLAILAN